MKIKILYGVFFITLNFLSDFNRVLAQITPVPSSTPRQYVNSVDLDNERKKYFLNYSGNDCNLKYEYSIEKGGSFNGIKVTYGNYTFSPSNFGGISIVSPDNPIIEYNPWSREITTENISNVKSKDTLITEWIMKKADEFYFHYQLKIFVIGKTLVVKMKDLKKIKNYFIKKYALISSVYLDRCEDAIDPVIIGIPYLTSFNILYSNNLFTSIFFDWTKSNASVLLPYEKNFSNTSCYFSQFAGYIKKTNGKKNLLDETIYMTVSTLLEEVLPNIPNPVSRFKKESVNRIIYDNWQSGFSNILESTTKLKNAGINNLWLIVHNWQNGGYDNKFPDFLPANKELGGNKLLKNLSDYCKSSGYLFALHENYTDFYPNSKLYNVEDVGLDPDKKLIKAWKTDIEQSYLLKPTKIKKYLVPISTKIQKTFKTNASFIDVAGARGPSEYVDFDYRITDAGKCAGTLREYSKVGDLLRNIHNGPVSTEGFQHFYYVGYYDDFSPQIETALISSEKLYGGYFNCLLVDFDLRKMHDKTFSHGVGYYGRFFNSDEYLPRIGASKDSNLIYAATEIAYGHGAFFHNFSYDLINQADLEYNYVYPLQLLYGNAKTVKILYNDNGRLISISDYIKRYPHTFSKFSSPDFLSQVYVEYDNGLHVYVNRHPTKNWTLDFTNLNTDAISGEFNYHLISNGSSVLYRGNQSPGNTVTLPKSNGWFCYIAR